MRSLTASFLLPASTGPAAPPAALVEAARVLQSLARHERRGLLRDEAAPLLDGLLTRVARSRSALDVALCEGLGALSTGDQLLRLGWSGVGDYARERLGVAARTGQVMARLGRALAERPLLRAAVRSGEVSVRAAEEVVAVAAGPDEARWMERARSLTVRALVSEVRRAQAGGSEGAASARAAPDEGAATGGSGPAPRCAPGDSEPMRATENPAPARAAATSGVDPDTPDGEPWQRIALEVTPSAREALERALDLAGQVLGEGAPRWQRLEAVAQEYLGVHGGDEADDEVVAATLTVWRGESQEDRHGGTAGDDAADATSHPTPGWCPQLEVALEEETARWAFLEAVPAVVTPSPDLEVHPARLDEALRELAALRERWESLLGHLALLVRMLGLWRDLRFVSYADHPVMQT